MFSDRAVILSYKILSLTPSSCKIFSVWMESFLIMAYLSSNIFSQRARSNLKKHIAYFCRWSKLNIHITQFSSTGWVCSVCSNFHDRAPRRKEIKVKLDCFTLKRRVLKLFSHVIFIGCCFQGQGWSAKCISWRGRWFGSTKCFTLMKCSLKFHVSHKMNHVRTECPFAE